MVKLKDWKWGFEVLPKTRFKGKVYVLENSDRVRRNSNARVNIFTRIVRVVRKGK